MKLEELPQHNGLGFFWWGRSLKIHVETKREVFMNLIPDQHWSRSKCLNGLSMFHMNDMIFVGGDTGKFSILTQHKTQNYFVVHMRT